MHPYNFRDSEGTFTNYQNSTAWSCRNDISFEKEPTWDSTEKGIRENGFRFKFNLNFLEVFFISAVFLI